MTTTRTAFIEAVRPNIVLPEDAGQWRDIVFGQLPVIGAPEQAVIDEAGQAFFAAAAQAAGAGPGAISRRSLLRPGTATGRKGKGPVSAAARGPYRTDPWS